MKLCKTCETRNNCPYEKIKAYCKTERQRRKMVGEYVGKRKIKEWKSMYK